MGNAIATITGTALIPGVSRNRRYYSPELVASAVERANERLSSGGLPLTMRTSHIRPDDAAFVPVTETVGRVTEMWLDEDGRAKFRAEIVDNTAGREVAALVDNRAGAPYIKGVSIRGSFLGRIERVQLGGQLVETADDMEIDGLDYTHKPGIDGAGVEEFAAARAAREAAEAHDPGDGRTPIYESVQEALVTAIEETSADTTTAVGEAAPTVYADLGYLADGRKRLPLDTAGQARKAWRHVMEADNARRYTAAQLKRIKGRTKAALGKHGIQVGPNGWLVETVEHKPGEVAESWMGERGSFSVCLDNGMVCVTISSYCLDPHDLDRIGRAAMDGACAAMSALDPDGDGDIDVPGTAADLDGDAGEAALTAPIGGGVAGTPTIEAGAVSETAAAQTDAAPAEDTTPASTEDADTTTTQESEGSMSETTTAAEASTPAGGNILLTEDQFAQLLTAVRGPAPAAAAAAPVAEAAPAPAAAVTETEEQRIERLVKTRLDAALAEAAPAVETPVTETEEQRIDRLVGARLTASIQEAVESGRLAPARKGLVGKAKGDGTVQEAAGGELNENGLPADWPNKPLHEYKGTERGRMSAALMQHVIGHRIP